MGMDLGVSHCKKCAYVKSVEASYRVSAWWKEEQVFLQGISVGFHRLCHGKQ